MLFAIDPGYASPVWPAAGLALAGVLHFGYRAWPGVFIGAVLINADHALDVATATAAAKSLALSGAVAFGATLQALVGAVLIRGSVGYPNRLDEGNEVARFIILAGPVACLVAATLGSATLLVSGILSPSDIPFTWWTWWVGDTIGVLTIAPVVCAWVGRRSERLRRRLTVALPFAATFVLAVVVFARVSGAEHELIAERFHERAAALADALEDRTDRYVDLLHSVASFYHSSIDVERAEFRAFVERALPMHDGVQALEWLPRVRAAERERFETAARRDGFPQYEIQERDASGELRGVSARAEYYPVYYVEPLVGNANALGFDVASNPNRRRALMQARDTGRPAATQPIRLVQEAHGGLSFLVFVPVYRGGVTPPSLMTRRELLQGFVVGVFRIDDVVTTSLARVDTGGVYMFIVDEQSPLQEQLLYSNARHVEELHAVSSDHMHTFRSASSFLVADRLWRMEFVATPAFVAEHHTAQAWIVLVGGLLYSSLLGMFLLFVTGRASKVEQLATQLTVANASLQRTSHELEQKVAELARSNADLESFAYLASHDLQEPLRMVGSYAQLLRDECRGRHGETADLYIDYVVDAAHRMRTLIADLLAYARLETRSRGLRPTDCNAILERVVQTLGVAIRDAGATVTWHDLPTVMGDPTQLEQLFQNLVSNAIKFRGDRAPAITIEAWHEAAGWHITVADNGIGLDMDFADRAFEIFQRLHTRREYEGTGVGLAICQKIVHRHGGHIWIESVLDRGTTVHFIIPGQPESRPSEATTATHERAATLTPV